MITAQNALPLWGLDGATVALIAARENSVYRVDHVSGSFALRLHRPGYRTDEQLNAELDWMAVIARAGLSVPTPMASLNGPYLQRVDGVQVDVLGWLTGQTLDRALPKLDPGARAQVFQTLGQTMADLHRASDAWPGGASCARPSWNADGLLGDRPLWDRFWDNPGLTPAQRAVFHAFRLRARADLDSLGASLDYGLIHADMVPTNVMHHNGALHIIDFDDGGFGYRLFDVATALFKLRNAPDYPALKAALLAGYHSRRTLDTRALSLFETMRAMTYVGWNITRAHEDPGGARNARFIAQAAALASAYLAP